MNLPIQPPYFPMEAITRDEIPEGPQWQYEPKWDGFRCLAFRDGDEVQLQSKAGEPLARYFPEIVEALLGLKAKHFVLDGEIFISSFDQLLQRIHPAASRIAKLSKETPASLVVFDLLVDERSHSLAERPLAERRPRLEAFAAKYLESNASLTLSPATTDIQQARAWLASAGAKLDGTIAKRLDLPYESGNRDGMVKVKNLRTADCVIGGFRYATKGKVVGSLLLGLYDREGLLNHVGFCSAIPAAEKKEITKKLEALIKPPGFTGKAPGGPSRWSTERSTEWEPLDPKLVVEVRYDHFSGGRFRHGTKLVRWRPDKSPLQCVMP
ncbi:MAG: dependent ligase [Bryobacterales bacterium]|nr:dependent ligase [Bryobacterales bacterium]